MLHRYSPPPPSVNLSGKLAEFHRARTMGDGKAVIVFSHGLGTDRNAWFPVANQLTADFLTVTFDLPGIGPHLPVNYDPHDFRSLASYAQSVVLLLREMGIERCIYVGHSVSCMIGALASIEAPSLFDQLIFLNGSPRYLNDIGYVGGINEADLAGLFAAMASDYKGWVAAFAPLAIPGDPGPAVKIFTDSLLAMRPKLTLEVARMIYHSDYRDLLGSICTPTTLIQSRSDVAVPDQVADYLHEHIRGSRLVRLNAVGHLPHLSAPGEVVRALKDHILSN